MFKFIKKTKFKMRFLKKILFGLANLMRIIPKII